MANSWTQLIVHSLQHWKRYLSFRVSDEQCQIKSERTKYKSARRMNEARKAEAHDTEGTEERGVLERHSAWLYRRLADRPSGFIILLGNRQAASKSRILETPICDSRTTAVYRRWNLFSISLMTKLTIAVSLIDPRKKYGILLRRIITSKILIDSQKDNYSRHCLLAEVARLIIDLQVSLKAVWIMWVEVQQYLRFGGRRAVL